MAEQQSKQMKTKCMENCPVAASTLKQSESKQDNLTEVKPVFVVTPLTIVSKQEDLLWNETTPGVENPAVSMFLQPGHPKIEMDSFNLPTFGESNLEKELVECHDYPEVKTVQSHQECGAHVNADIGISYEGHPEVKTEESPTTEVWQEGQDAELEHYLSNSKGACTNKTNSKSSHMI